MNFTHIIEWRINWHYDIYFCRSLLLGYLWANLSCPSFRMHAPTLLFYFIANTKKKEQWDRKSNVYTFSFRAYKFFNSNVLNDEHCISDKNWETSYKGRLLKIIKFILSTWLCKTILYSNNNGYILLMIKRSRTAYQIIVVKIFSILSENTAV